MKLLVFTDVHGDTEVLAKLHQKVKREKPDALICAGDISNFGFGIKAVLKRLNSFGVPIFMVPGQPPHETYEHLVYFSKGLKNIRNLHLKSTLFQSLYIIGYGEAGFDQRNADFELSEKKFSVEMRKMKLKNYKTLLITHQPPYKTSLDALYGGHVGSISIRKFIQLNQPDYCITGHIHENEGKHDKVGKTMIINPGPEGKIIEI